MFGEFSIRYGDRELAGNIGRSKKVWALVEYLLANRGKEIPLDRMMGSCGRRRSMTTPSIF